MSTQGLTLYQTNTHTEQYVHYDSFIPWNYKITWICSLFTRPNSICCVNLLPEEINVINKFGSWNGFPKSILTSIIKHAIKKSISDSRTDGDNDVMKFYMML